MAGNTLTGAFRRYALARAIHSVQPDHSVPVHVSGPHPHRVLVIGAETVAGYEARTDELTLPGHLARSFSALSGRGVDVDVVARSGMDATEAVDRLIADERDLGRYSGVVLSIAGAEIVSFLSDRRWAERLDRLLTFVEGRVSEDCGVILLLPRVTTWTPYVSGAVVARIAGRATRWTHIAETVAARHPRVDLFTLPGRTTAPGTPWRAADYSRWGHALAQHLHGLMPEGSRTRSEETISEDAIRRATDALPSPLHGRPGEEVSHILHLVKDWFDADAVALMVVDGDEVVVTRAIGLSEGARTPREQTPCDTTIRRPAGHVVPSLDEHPAYAPLAERTGFRFYAGYRIEASNGVPVGTLCVFRTEAGGTSTDDEMAILRDFASRLSLALTL